ncbi:hypothetical protein CIG11343_1635 [Campylobacter iguaniorum]|uniref:hypothetical protein n=1 Tax=Campylobacter iguaniorum TaxID=1244531 RepID=UPI0007C93C94|nr:hypothetical protein [Campylobacter iguaniorum]ANE36596.1 hypothetical protein CIG11343_1635 [Campylobacter iguaniorum]
MKNFVSNLENLISHERLNSYNNIQEHFYNLKFISTLTPNLATLEISLRNIIDHELSKTNQNWLFNFQNENIQEKITKLQNKKQNLTSHQILSRLNLGNIIEIIKDQKIQNKILDLSHINFIDYSKSNRMFGYVNYKKIDFSNIDKVNIVLSLLQNIRNRSYHWENLLKTRINNNKEFPRLTTKYNSTNVGIDPNKIKLFLDDLIISINKDLKKYCD